MGGFARDDRKSSVVAQETMVGVVRASSKPKRHNHDSSLTPHPPNSPLTPLDQEHPNKKMKLLHEVDHHIQQQQQSSKLGEEKEEEEFDGEEEEEEGCDAEPIGDSIRVSVDGGGGKRVFFGSFQFDGNVFHLEDTVLVAPEEGKVKPSVAIVKDIFQADDGILMVRGRRFYRPEEAEKKEGGTWQSRDPRELFLSSYLDEVDATTVMHRCVIHLIPLGKTVPDRKENPGFIVRKFYSFETKEIRNLIEKDCEGVGADSQPAAA